MEPTGSRTHAKAPHIAAAFAVHVFTASGAACALLALMAAVAGEWPKMFLWLGIALIIDGVDGTLARQLRVAEVLPRWSGDMLDFVVDFTTYVFVPAYAIATGGLLPRPLALPLGLIVAVTGALYFADRRMKTPDNYFRGFPALWNIAAFYLFVLKPPPWAGAIAIAVLAAATFAAHPFRAPDPRTALAPHQSRGPGAVGLAGAGCAGAKPRSAGLGRGSAERDRDLFRDRRAVAHGRLIPCTVSVTTYDRAPFHVGATRSGQWLLRYACTRSVGPRF